MSVAVGGSTDGWSACQLGGVSGAGTLPVIESNSETIVVKQGAADRQDHLIRADRGQGAVSAARSQALAQDRERGFVQPQYAVVVFVFP